MNILPAEQVVLPDAKRSENDIVVFLDERFAASDMSEAEQHGAIQALHRVAGDRQLHLLLPPQVKRLGGNDGTIS